jgi:hypothetical protein
MPECFCPEELGGACYFAPVTAELSDWMPTHEHYPLSRRESGKVAVNNAILAHRRRKAREDAIRRNNEGSTP